MMRLKRTESEGTGEKLASEVGVWPHRAVLMLNVALGRPERARSAWEELRPTFDVDALEGDWYRLGPLMAWNLARSGVTGDLVVDSLLSITRKAWAQNLRLLVAFGDVAAELEASGVDVVALKGAALVVDTYPSPGLRPMDDLDLLVRPADQDGAAQVLRSRGYELVHRASAGHASAWRRPDRLDVDLHTQPNPWLFQRPDHPGLSALWANLEDVDLPDGRRVRAVGAADQLLVVFVHGIRGGSEVVRWAADATWLARSGRVEWDHLVAQARRYGVSSIVEGAVHSLEDALGERVVPGRVVRELASQRRSVLDRLTRRALYDPALPDVVRSVVLRARTLPDGERLRAVPAMVRDRLGVSSGLAAVVDVARRGPGWAARVVRGGPGPVR